MKLEQEPKYDAVRGRLQNRETGKNIPEDEPVMVFRAQDARALPAIRKYKKECTDSNHRRVVQKRINAFVAWQRNNKDKVKEPDSQKTAPQTRAA